MNHNNVREFKRNKVYLYTIIVPLRSFASRKDGGDDHSSSSPTLMLPFATLFLLSPLLEFPLVMEMLFGEFGTFGDGLETKNVILVHKTSFQLSQRPNAAAKTSRWRNPLLPARYLEDAAAK
ncbi:hypothetical protein YC2023_077644 [Brassica napus]